MPTLLEKIKSQQSKLRRIKFVDKEDEDVAIAWMQNEISYSQIIREFKVPGQVKGPSRYALLARGLKSAFHNGRIKII